jgi:type VI secretion system protein ImpK
MAAPVRDEQDFATHQFRAFYAEVLRTCGMAQTCPAHEAPAMARKLSQSLEQFIELQTLEARRMGGKAALDTDPKARFLKASLADEMLLNLDWAGRQHWRHELLEARMFRSSMAGDRVFEDIHQLLSLREPAQRPLARLYLHTLALGFQGRYRGSQAMDALAAYRRELYQFAWQKPPQLAEPGRQLCPQAYRNTLSHLAAQRIPRLNRWSFTLMVAALSLLAASELLWLWQSWPVRQLIGP